MPTACFVNKFCISGSYVNKGVRGEYDGSGGYITWQDHSKQRVGGLMCLYVSISLPRMSFYILNINIASPCEPVLSHVQTYV